MKVTDHLKVGIYTEMMGPIHSGGIRCIVELLNGLIDRGHEAICFVQRPPYDSTWLPSKFPVYPGSEIHNFDGILISPYTPTAREVANCGSASRRIYWVHTYEPAFVHNSMEWRQESNNSYLLDNIEYVATSHYVSIILDLLYGRKVSPILLPPGVDHQLFIYTDWKKRRKDKFVIGMLARPDWVRGTDTGMQVIELLQKKYGDKVEFFPFANIPQSEMHKAYGYCHVFLDPSRLAGFPMPPLEAMACGTIPLITHFGSDYIHDEKNGFLIAKDDVQGIFERLCFLIENQNILEAISTQAYEDSLKWSWANTLDRFIKIIN